jgi:hypothetical protein
MPNSLSLNSILRVEPFLIAEADHEASMIQLRKEYMIRELHVDCID